MIPPHERRAVLLDPTPLDWFWLPYALLLFEVVFVVLTRFCIKKLSVTLTGIWHLLLTTDTHTSTTGK